MGKKTTKLLVIDDEPDTMKVMKLILNRHSQYQYRSAFSGKEALQLLQNYSPDIILLDVVMPGIDGYELCRLIRKENRHKFAKIIMISGMALIEDRLKGYDAGADDYLAKPFVRKEFLAKLAVYSKLSRMEEVDSLKTTALNLLCHETRTPLNGIIMGSELLAESLAGIEGIPIKANQYLDLIRESGVRIQDMVAKISRYNSVREGNKKYYSTQMLTTIVNSISETIAKSDKQLRLKSSCDSDIKFVTDWALLEECVGYVVENAVKNSQKFGTIELKCWSENTQVVIQISDDGPTLEASVRQRIFDTLFHPDLLHHGQGTGINLAIAKEIIDDLGGKISCKDGSSGGSLFEISLNGVSLVM